jgi:hypothetical protein
MAGDEADEADRIAEGFRLQAFTAAEAFLRMVRSAAEHYGDLDTATVYIAVVTAGLAGATRDPEVIERYAGNAPIPDAYFRAVSRRAIAESTGLARETTRRKVARLVEQGRLIEDTRGAVRGRFNLLSDSANLAFARSLVQEFRRTAERLERLAPADPITGGPG